MTATQKSAELWFKEQFRGDWDGECSARFQAELLRQRLEEHGVTCSKTLLQYDEKMKPIGNIRCGKGWDCPRRADLERQLRESEGKS